MSPLSSKTAAQEIAKLLDTTGCVIFDFDGVVVDSEPFSLGTLRDTLSTFGLEMSLDHVRAEFLGKSLKTIESHLEQNSEHGMAQDFSAAWQDALFKTFRAKLQRMPEIATLLAQLDESDLPYCIASSSSFERLDVALNAVDFSDRFAFVFSAEQVTHGKPAPDLFLLAADQMRVEPARCLVIEDSPHGVQAAQAAGMTSIGFVGGSHLHGIEADHTALLLEAGAAYVVDNFLDLMNRAPLRLGRA